MPIVDLASLNYFYTHYPFAPDFYFSIVTGWGSQQQFQYGVSNSILDFAQVKYAEALGLAALPHHLAINKACSHDKPLIKTTFIDKNQQHFLSYICNEPESNLDMSIVGVLTSKTPTIAQPGDSGGMILLCDMWECHLIGLTSHASTVRQIPLITSTLSPYFYPVN